MVTNLDHQLRFIPRPSGAKKYWAARKNLFSKEYQAYIENIDNNAYMDMHQNI